MLEPCACCGVGAGGAEVRGELRRLAARRRELVLRALDAATSLKARLEHELAMEVAGAGADPAAGDSPAALRARLLAAAREARVDDLVLRAAAPLHADQVRRALAGLDPDPTLDLAPAQAESPARDPALLLANVCLAALWARSEACPPPSAPQCALPRYYLDMSVDGTAAGRVVVAVRADVAPRMARNFAALIAGPRGAGYRGCAVFQCWERESVITGDYELNNGRGGRCADASSGGHFAPDEARLPAARGAVGMRREQRRHDRLGQVGSQFRIMLREMRGFSAVFGFVVEGLPLVERLARAGDSAGKPHAHILIADCGRLY